MCQYARDIFVCRKCISVWLFTVKALLLPENYTVEFILCEGNPQWIGSFRLSPLIDVIDLWLKDWFQVRTSIARWIQERIQAKIMHNGFEISG